MVKLLKLILKIARFSDLLCNFHYTFISARENLEFFVLFINKSVNLLNLIFKNFHYEIHTY